MAKIKNKVNNEVELIKNSNEDTDQVKTFILILVGVALVSVLLYFVTTKLVIKDGVKKDPDTTEESVAYNNVNVGNVFNRPEDEYYVFAYDTDSLQASYYSAILNSYKADKVKMYFLNLSLGINKDYVQDKSNPSATKAGELAFSGPTLIKIKDGKIVTYLENIDEIIKELR